MPDSEPELIVDSDWKAQVEKEKQQAAAAKDAGKTPSDEPTDDSSAVVDTDAIDTDAIDTDAIDSDPADHGPIPPASLEVLLTTLYSQTMMSLGVIPNPSTQQAKTDLPMAKHFIDTIEILQTKTTGNTSDDESKMFEEILYNLRMAYVQMSKNS
ncbi:DUF1844 domain-containing protein [Stieleria varia]|uniref:DUF1844 domain-containing protein n=1 Tax=Stieleria varia TaxID=2528005 RepID=A0A5C6AWJ3_9BACT|nr:DUF1844 domain-containing protein [Stieleria varia]TWU04395.1 hypothetical protein Pla52n_24350 [Stieleria varia]